MTCRSDTENGEGRSALRSSPFARLILCVDESGLIFYGEP